MSSKENVAWVEKHGDKDPEHPFEGNGKYTIERTKHSLTFYVHTEYKGEEPGIYYHDLRGKIDRKYAYSEGCHIISKEIYNKLDSIMDLRDSFNFYNAPVIDRRE